MKQYAYRIFISGTYTNLTTERKAAEEILERLEYIVVTMPFPAAPGGGVEIKRKESLRELDKADAMILIIGGRYGKPDLPGDPRSITEVEFDWAVRHQIPCYVFVQESWSTQETDPALAEQHKKFKAKIDAEKLRDSFRNPDNLKSQIQLALYEHPVAELVFGKPFHRWDQFFREMLTDGAPIHLSLTHPILCRANQLKTLQDFSKSVDSRVCSVVAGQGMGKSRLLLEFAQRAPQKVTVLFLNVLSFNSDYFDKATIESIPKNRDLIVVLDDAHDVQNLLVAVLQILEARPLAKVLITGRPSPGFQSAVNLLEENHKTFRLIQMDLPPLSVGPELTAYVASQFPGHGNPEESAKRLHIGSGGVAWILHFGILFWKEKGSFPHGLISRDPSFRDFVLKKILGNRQNKVTGQMLQWLAIISPVERDRKKWGEIIQKLLECSDMDIGTAVELWCQERLLRTKGRNLLFVSEIVRDFFVLQLAHTPVLREKIFDHFWNPILKNVLRNLSVGAALDRYDDSGQPSKVAPVFEDVWEKFRKTFFKESAYGQQDILSWLEPVAWYQPGNVRDLLAHLQKNPSKTPVPPEVKLFDIKWSHRDVLEKFTPLLKAIAHHPDYFDWATDLLWELASSDKRETNPFPEHPMRTLGDIAKYRPGKPLWLTDKLVERVAKWTRGTAGKTFPQSPVKSILGAALAREAEIGRFQGFTFTWGAMPVPSNLVLNIQNKALDLMVEILQDQGQSFAAHFVIDAIDVLLEFSSGPHRLSMARFSDADEAAWTTRAEMTLQRIYKLVNHMDFLPIVRFEIWEKLRWLAMRGRNPLQELARKIRDLLEKQEPRALEFRIYKCSLRDFHENSDIWAKRRQKSAMELLEAYPKTEEFIRFLNDVMNSINRFGVARADPYMILKEAGQIAPEQTIALAQEIVSTDQKALFHFLPDLIGPTERVNDFETLSVCI